VNGCLQIYEDAGALNEALAQAWVRLAREAIAERGAFYVALAGGSTPRQLYARLAAAPFRDAVDWPRVQVFFGDERCVPRDHADSNYRMAHEALLSRVPIAAAQVHPLFDPALTPSQNAENYTAQLLAKLPLAADGVPVFDLVLLGMGDDGHTASLFPATSILQESERMVAAVYVDRLQAWRVSLTLPLINHARHVAIAVAGAGKAAMLKAVLTGSERLYPVQGVKPQGELRWFADAAAAQHLPEEVRQC
jgi:6-phosphogluconolactonase